MIAAVGLFTLMDAIAKYLSRWYPVPGIVWARYALNLIMLLAWLAARGELRRIRTARPGIQLARGLLLATATLIYFTSLTVLPLADAAAIAFVLPLFVAARPSFQDPRTAFDPAMVRARGPVFFWPRIATTGPSGPQKAAPAVLSFGCAASGARFGPARTVRRIASGARGLGGPPHRFDRTARTRRAGAARTS